MLTSGSLWAKDDEVIVTRQLTLSQRKSLPDKTITTDVKRLTFNKKADASLVDAITQVMDTIASEDYQNRTFVLLLEGNTDGTIAIAARNDDIVTRGSKDASIYYGELEHKRYHFVVLMGKDNQELLEQTFKRQGKVKFVQEFEFVDFPTPRYPTNVIGEWSPSTGFKWKTVTINEDLNADRDSLDRPAHFQD
ncbi:MAG: hypothetical protein IKH25_01080, partial [Muribaculaceae bacterium]|nr:hypothetical protein [Muribaculaceae bacterium]